jgi:hypothetical protein
VFGLTHENWGLGHIETWKLFKELFLQQFLPGNFNSSMRQSMYKLRQGSMSVAEFKLKFDEHVAYFPSWMESDRVEFFVEHVRESIKYKVNPYAPSSLSEAFCLALNFELEGGLDRFGKRSDGTSSQNQTSKSTKFSKSDRFAKPTQNGRKGFNASRLSDKEVEEHRKKNLCFTCHKSGHQRWECPTSKRHAAVMEVDETEEEVQKEDNETVQVSKAMMNMEVEQEPTVVQIKGFVNSSFSSMILIDSGSTHNMISADFAKKLGLPLVPTKLCLVLLPNNQSSSIDHRLVNVPISIQGVHTTADFEVWNGARYDVILGMAWLREVDAWIACKEGAIHGKLQNGKAFCIKGKRSLPNIPLLSHLQMKGQLRNLMKYFWFI